MPRELRVTTSKCLKPFLSLTAPNSSPQPWPHPTPRHSPAMEPSARAASSLILRPVPWNPHPGPWLGGRLLFGFPRDNLDLSQKPLGRLLPSPRLGRSGWASRAAPGPPGRSSAGLCPSHTGFTNIRCMNVSCWRHPPRARRCCRRRRRQSCAPLVWGWASILRARGQFCQGLASRA